MLVIRSYDATKHDECGIPCDRPNLSAEERLLARLRLKALLTHG